MGLSAIELGGRRYQVIDDDVDSMTAYGRWDALVAISQDAEAIGACRAHAGDFYPECVSDYVDTLRALHANPSRSPWPLRVDIDITQACNAACIFCFSQAYRHGEYGGAHIGEEDLISILKTCRLRGTRTVRYCGGGDPLAIPNVDRFLTLPHENGLKLVVITSGDMIDDRAAIAITRNVDHLHWSVNAASDRTRAQLHRTGNKARPLSETRNYIRSIIEAAMNRVERRPLMVWATYIMTPENVDEIVKAATQLRDIGVDSVSFRPVYHGLHSPWTEELMRKRDSALKEVRSMSVPPKFHVFVPNRSPEEATNLKPTAFFTACRSRLMRTVIEATHGGARLQSCGLYRGVANTGQNMRKGNLEFGTAWNAFLRQLTSSRAPQDCSRCIDVSINMALEFIDVALVQDSSVRFYRARTL